MKRRIVFWVLVVLATAFLADPILNLQYVLGENSLFTPEGWPTFYTWTYVADFDDPRDTFRSLFLIAALIGLGALAGWPIVGRLRLTKTIAVSSRVIIAALVFRGTEVLTDILMYEGICAGSRTGCPSNVAMGFWDGDRFTIIAYLALGAAVVVGGVLARKSWRRFVAPPMQTPSAAMAEEQLVPERPATDAAEGPEARTTAEPALLTA